MKKVSGSANEPREGLSRRTMLGGAALVAGIGASAVLSTTAQAKVPQNSAKYQDSPKGSSKCEGCSQFQAPDACKVVDGKVSPNGWCQLFSPKAG